MQMISFFFFFDEWKDGAWKSFWLIINQKKISLLQDSPPPRLTCCFAPVKLVRRQPPVFSVYPITPFLLEGQTQEQELVVSKQPLPPTQPWRSPFMLGSRD